jgi:hypothetical protein
LCLESRTIAAKEGVGEEGMSSREKEEGEKGKD